MNCYTLFLIKPDSTEKNRIGTILRMVEENGFIIKEMKMFTMDAEFAASFYDIHQGKYFYQRLVDFMCSGKTVACILYKKNAVNDLRDLIGETEYDNSKPGTIRHLYGETITRNAVHASDSEENAGIEIRKVFPEFKYE